MELGRLYRLARKGEIDTLDASRMARILEIIWRIIEGSETLRRIEELERLAAEQDRQRLAA